MPRSEERWTITECECGHLRFDAEVRCPECESWAYVDQREVCPVSELLRLREQVEEARRLAEANDNAAFFASTELDEARALLATYEEALKQIAISEGDKIAVDFEDAKAYIRAVRKVARSALQTQEKA